MMGLWQCRFIVHRSPFSKRWDGGERQSSHHTPPRPMYRFGAPAHGCPCGHNVIQDQHLLARYKPRVVHLQLPVESGCPAECAVGFHGFALYVPCS